MARVDRAGGGGLVAEAAVAPGAGAELALEVRTLRVAYDRLCRLEGRVVAADAEDEAEDEGAGAAAVRLEEERVRLRVGRVAMVVESGATEGEGEGAAGERR